MYMLVLDQVRGEFKGCASMTREEYDQLEDKYKEYWVEVDDDIFRNDYDYMDDCPFE